MTDIESEFAAKLTGELPGQSPMTLDQFERNVRAWAADRGIYMHSTPEKQYCKFQEEAIELLRALLNDDRRLIVDGIGDCIVVLINIAAMRNIHLAECIEQAWSEIKHRTGKMAGGVFVKDSPKANPSNE